MTAGFSLAVGLYQNVKIHTFILLKGDVCDTVARVVLGVYQGVGHAKFWRVE